jgi:hypothetical protein
VRVHLSPDLFVGFPVEVVEGGSPGYVSAHMLGISDVLARDLEAFQEWWENLGGGDDDLVPGPQDPAWRQWDAEGWQLVKRLQDELGPEYDVVWIGSEQPEH